MIRCLKRNDIDIEKYDSCIENSFNSRIYAYSWYLDIVADNWDVLVLDDYEAVMPLPYLRLKRNFFLKKIYQPPFCQQLGVFYTRRLSENEQLNLLKQFNLLKPVQYHFNSDNSFAQSFSFLRLNHRINFELDLNSNCDNIERNYSKNLIRNLKKSSKNNLRLVNDISISDLILMKKENKKHSISTKQFKMMKSLLYKLSDKKFGNVYGVKYKNILIGSAFMVKLETKIVHLISATNQMGKDKSAIPFLFNELIRENSNKNMIFDFEGSMIPGVAQFFKSFGSKPILYYVLKND